MSAAALPSTLRWDRQQWQALRWQHAALKGELARLSLAEAEFSFTNLRLCAVTAGELVLEGLRLQASVTATELLAAVRGDSTPPALDALRGMEGRLQSFVTDAAWILDATLTLPVHQGRIDFDQVQVEHLGPDSSMGLSAGGLYVDAPQLGRRYLYLFSATLPAGLQAEQRQGRRVADRGLADLPQLLFALLQSAQAPGRWANGDARDAALSRSRLAGELQLGDGELRALGAGLHLSGHALGANRVALSSPALDESVTVRMPQVAAERLQAEQAGWQLEGERLEGQLVLQAMGDWTRGGPLQLTLEAPRLLLRGLKARATGAGHPDKA
jgi:hypothetical protein